MDEKEYRERNKEISELKAYAGTDVDPLRYRDSLHDKWIFITFALIIGGLIATFIIGGMGYRFIAPKVFFGALFASSITGLIAYFIPLITLKRQISYLRERCTERVTGRCVRTGEITYSTAYAAQVIMPFYRTTKEEEHKSAELYYDPEYVIEFSGKTYHLCERRFSLSPATMDSERTLYIDPSAPTVFFDERRYGSEYKEAKEKCFAGVGSRIVFIIITAILFWIFAM